MRAFLRRLAPVFRLTRITSAFAAVANVWFVVLWTRSYPEHETGATIGDLSIALALSASAALALGLFMFGTVMNDVLDLRRDRAFRPDRPLPAGEVSLEGAFAVIVGSLLAAVLAATVFGSAAVLTTLAVAAAILAFNAVAKFIPAMGLVLLSLIYAGHMLTPNIRLQFVWPVWLAMTHTLIVAGVTHGMARKVPRLSRRALAAAALGWVFWSALLLWIGWERSGRPRMLWPDWVPLPAAAGPAGLALLFLLAAWLRVRRLGPGPRAAEKVSRYGSLWLALYSVAWMFGVGRATEGLILLGLTLAGLGGMTIVREAYALVENPLGYRR